MSRANLSRGFRGGELRGLREVNLNFWGFGEDEGVSVFWGEYYVFAGQLVFGGTWSTIL